MKTLLERLPKTLNKKYHHMIAEYDYCTTDRIHDIVLKENYRNDNDGQAVIERTVKELNEALANCIEIEKEEKQMETTFKVGQKFKMIRHDFKLGQRQAEIVSIDGDKAWVRIGKTNYLATIKRNMLMYPSNMREYLNTSIKDLV